MKLSRGRLAIIIIVGIIVLVAIITPIAYFASRSSNKTEDKPAETGTETERLDCYPEARSPAVVLTREVCELRGCVFDSSALSGGGVACYYPKSGGLRYQVEGRENLPNGFKVQLRRLGPSPFSEDFRKPSLEVQKLSNVLLRFTVRTLSPPFSLLFFSCSFATALKSTMIELFLKTFCEYIFRESSKISPTLIFSRKNEYFDKLY